MKTCLLIILSLTSLLAKAQSFDESFSDHGVLIDKRINESSNGLAIQKDGKIILGGGNFLLARYNQDGTPDSKFGNDGIASNEALMGAVCNDIVLQTDGKILAAGSISNRNSTNKSDAIVVRFKSDGVIDSSFGTNGIVVSDVQQEDEVNKIALLSDGKIVITGTASNEGGETQKPGGLFVNRYLPTGEVDQIFGIDGSVLLMKSLVYSVNGLAVDLDGNIFIAYDSASGTLSFILIKLNNHGTLVSSFGNNGQAEILIPGTGSGSLNDINLHDGSIFATGYSQYKGKGIRNLTLVKCSSNGQPDVTFGHEGVKILEMGFNWTEGNQIGISSDSNIIIAGRFVEAYPSTKFYASLYAFSKTGNVDSAFGTNGYLLNVSAGDNSLYEKLYVDEGEIFFASGSSYFSSTNTTNYMVTKYLATGNIKNPKYVRIKKWLHRNGFTWEDWPGRNINYYLVQRSGDGNSFTQIAKIFQRSNNKYSFEDAAPLIGNNYYRVTAVNANGSATQSNVISIVNGNNEATIYPNPVNNTLQIAGLSKTQPTKLTITTFGASTLKSVVTNSENYAWNVSQLKPGNYILTITSGSNSVSKKFVKE